MAAQIHDPLLPPGSLILVTAANGLIASHIVDQLLLHGYAVCCTVRSLERSKWMMPLFRSRHVDGTFEVVQVPNILDPDCYSRPLERVSAVIHTAALNLLSDDPAVIPDSIKANINVLEQVAKANAGGANIKRVVLTSSSWAVKYPVPNIPMELTSDTYDTTAQGFLASPHCPKEARGLFTYVVAKLKSEQESWKWVNEHKDVGFVLNAVHPATCFGPVLAPNDQPYPSTAGFVRSLYEGKNAQFFEWLEPQWFVDVRDAARLHVAAAVLNGAEQERVFAWTAPYTWPGVASVIEEEMGKKCGVQPKGKGEDLTTPAEPRKRATELLQRLGQSGWIGFEEAVRDNIRSFYPA